MANAEPFVNGRLKRSQIVVFSKSYSPEGRICAELLKDYEGYLPEEIFEWVDIEKRSDCSQVEDYLWLLSGKNNREVPLMFIKQRFVGGYTEILQMHKEDRLGKLLASLKLGGNVSDDEEEDDGEAVGKDKEVSQVTVRVQQLDETEVLIRLSDPFTQGRCNQPDYDSNLRMAGDIPLDDLLVLFRQTEKDKEVPTISVEEDNMMHLPIDYPEWMITSGTPHKEFTISRETSIYVLKKMSISTPDGEVPQDATTPDDQEFGGQNVVGDPKKYRDSISKNSHTSGHSSGHKNREPGGHKKRESVWEDAGAKTVVQQTASAQESKESSNEDLPSAEEISRASSLKGDPAASRHGSA